MRSGKRFSLCEFLERFSLCAILEQITYIRPLRWCLVFEDKIEIRLRLVLRLGFAHSA